MQVMGGNIDFYFIPLAAAASALGSDKLVLLAVSSPKRAALLPNVPSVAELGYPDAVFRFWNGISAPAKTPRDIVNKLHDVTETALKDSALREKLAKLGVRTSADECRRIRQVFQRRSKRDGGAREESRC